MDLGVFHVEGWDALVAYLQRRTDVAYVSLVERDGRDGETSLGRLPEAGQGDLSDLENDPVGAALEWLKELIQRHCTGEARTRLRLYVYGPKGENRGSATMVVTSRQDHALQTAGHRAEAVVHRIAMARAEREEEQVGTLVDQILGAAKQLGQIAVDLAAGTAKHYQGALNQLSHELEATRAQNDKLVQSVVQIRIDHAETRASQMLEESKKAQDDKRLQLTEELGKQAIDQMGGLVSLFAAGQAGGGLDPQLRPLLDAISKNETLLGALKDPKVHNLLHQPGAPELLAQFIQGAAQQAAQQPSSTPETK